MRVLQLVLGVLPLVSARSLQPRAGTITLDASTTYQKIIGFGASEAFQHSKQFYNLSTPIRQQVLDILFNTTSGAGLTILRNIITTGGIEPTSPGSATKTPTYTWDGSDNEQVWLSKTVQDVYGVKTIYANAWSAPGYMKTNNNADNGGYLCGVTGQTCSSGNWVQAYADYLTQYVKDYNSSGVAISHVGFLNEADASFSYDSMRSDGAQAAQVITALRATLDAAGFTSVLINCCDFEGWGISQTVLQGVKSAGAIDKLGGMTSHGYTGAPGAPFTFSNLPVWQTEWADLNSAWTTSFSSGGTASGLTWAQHIQSGVTTSNLSAFLYWIGAEPAVASSSAMLVQWTATSVTASKRLWAFAHFGRFVRPGAVRIKSSSAGGLGVSAFKNTDGTLSLQVINSGASAEVTVSGFGDVTQVQPILTDDANAFEFGAKIAVSSGSFSASIPGKAMMSFIPG
jgi:O-glycosyl hydrolase